MTIDQARAKYDTAVAKAADRYHAELDKARAEWRAKLPADWTPNPDVHDDTGCNGPAYDAWLQQRIAEHRDRYHAAIAKAERAFVKARDALTT